MKDLIRVEVKLIDKLLLNFWYISCREVYFVENWHHIQVCIKCMVEVRESLCLNAFGSINNEYGTFASSYTSTDLVSEVHMAWSVNQVQEVGLAIFRVCVDHRGCLGEHCDASLSLDD